MVVGSNEDVAAASFLTLHGDNIEEYDKQVMATNIYFEYLLPSNKKYFFHQHMVDFLIKIELSDQKYQNNGSVRDENYKGNLLFSMKYFVSFGTDRQ